MSEASFNEAMAAILASHRHPVTAAARIVPWSNPDDWGGIHNNHVTQGDFGQLVVARPYGIDDVVNGLSVQLGAIKDTTNQQIAAAQQAYAATPDNSDFLARMNAARDQAKQQSDAAVNAAYAKLTQIGQEHPDAQPLILQATQQVVGIVTGVTQTISGALGSAVDAVIPGAGVVITAPLNAVISAAETAVNAISSVVDDAVDAISSIFSGW
ncbi:hypothetical protein [Caulobacter segnis]